MTGRSMGCGVVLGLVLCVSQVNAGGLFNLPDDVAVTAEGRRQPLRSTQEPVAQAKTPAIEVRPPVLEYAPVTPPPASAVPSVGVSPDVRAQLSRFDRNLNETDESYVARMKGVYEQAKEESQRAAERNGAMLRGLAPDAFYRGLSAQGG